MKRKLLTLLTAGAVSATALTGAAFANSDSADQAEVQTFLGAAQDITAAIGAAEAASGGTAVAAEFEEKKGTAFYEVDIVANGKQVSVEIDATSGKVIKTDAEGDAEEGDIVDPAQLGASLAKLVATAKQNGSGKVMSISTDHENGQAVAIEVELANADGTTQEFTMAADGSLTPAVDGQDEGDKDDD